MIRPLHFVSTALLALVLVTAADAGAVEKQHHVGVSGGPATLVIQDKTTWSVGGFGGLHYSYGLTDAFNFMAEGSWAVVALGEEKGQDIPKTRPASVGHLGAGVGYVLDVIQWVPYIGLLGTGYILQGGSMDRPRGGFGVELALGLDYQLSRSFAVGVGLRQHAILTALGTYPSYSQALLRAELAWGW